MSDLDSMSLEELEALKANNGRVALSRGPSAAMAYLKDEEESPLDDMSLDQLEALRAEMLNKKDESVRPDRTFSGSVKALGTGTVKGLGDVGRGFGILNQLSEKEKAEFQSLADQYPEATVGEVIGQVAPFMVPGAFAARIASVPVRVAASALLGGSEGFVVTKGQGGTNTEAATMAGVGTLMGGTFEVAFPYLSRGASAVARSLGLKKSTGLLTKEGKPTPQFQKALDDAGIDFSDIEQSALAEVRKLSGKESPEQVARMTRFRSEGIKPTQGQVTQDFAQQAKESRLESMASGEAGDPLRQSRLIQSEKFQNNIDEFVDSLGVPDQAGENIKAALKSRKTMVRTEKNKYYQQVAEVAPEVANAPIITDTIIEALPNKATLRRIQRLAPTGTDALDDLLIEFGLDQSPEAMEAFMKSGGEITPLTLGNFDDFRQAINLIERTDQTGALSVITGPIKTALDGEATLIDDAVKNSGLSADGVLDLLDKARAGVRELKTEFSDQAISGRLINTKRDGFTPVVEASKVTQKLLSPNAPIEELRAVLNNLAKAGPKGAQAIGDLQAATVLQAMEAALKAPSRKTAGIETMGGNQFAKALTAIGDDKLALIFQGNEEALKRLKNLKQLAKDMEPTAGAVPKGSAPVILDALNTVNSGAGLMSYINLVKVVGKAGADDRAVSAALKGKPEVIENAREISRLYPTLATALGLGVLLNVDDANE